MINGRTVELADKISMTERSAGPRLLGSGMKAMSEQLLLLADSDLASATDCTGWTVRDILAHLVGSAQEAKWPWGLPIRSLRGHRRYPEMAMLDARNQMQVDDLKSLDNAELVALYAQLRQAAVAGAKRADALVGRLKIPSGLPGVPRIGVRYLMNVICLRDVWMHGVDIAYATGTPRVGGDHDEVAVTQVVRDLAGAWTGSACELQLTGVSNRCWRIGDGPITAHLGADAIELCRLLAGRPGDAPELISGDPAARQALAEARVLF